MDPITNTNYYDEGIALVAKHLGVTAEFHGIKETGGYFWCQLALKLLQTHVPYFMPPAQRGAPSTLQSLFPMLEMFVAGIKKGDAMSLVRAQAEQTAAWMGLPSPVPPAAPPVTWTIKKAYTEVAKLARCTPETVEREFAKWRKQKRLGGGNSSK
jgi:hypothetical protein